MTACYAPGAHFRDPAFGDLEGDDVGAMWRMLTGRAADLEIELREHEAGRRPARATGSPATRSPPAAPSSTTSTRPSASPPTAGSPITSTISTSAAGAKQALGPSGHLVLLPPLRAKARAKALDQLETFKREETGSSI